MRGERNASEVASEQVMAARRALVDKLKKEVIQEQNNAL
jgi:hypothetical protein